ncbi:Hypothetical predicted protein [Cloeon dipterum]|uniref:C-type lectin domain-containing protein n=1 Tax=Cloeon dipterum TaxID=197152 RepID=A0A8S1CPG2_9INSE|nr:Hypothetical predicted protein [Cloeon dipterum]
MMFLLRFFASALLVQTVFGAPEGVGKDITNSTKGLRFTIGTSEYTVLPELFSWLLAKYACKELGMELVSIESAEENRAITQNIAEIYKNEYFWTSGVRVGTFNEYYWESTGTFFGPYTNWDSTSPTFDDMLMYVEFNTFLNPGAEIKWNDFYANYGRMALCELRAQTYDTSVKTKPGLFRIGDGFYEISPIKLPWHHAKNDCRSKGMDLLSIETEEENIALIAALRELIFLFYFQILLQPCNFQRNMSRIFGHQEVDMTLKIMSGRQLAS